VIPKRTNQPHMGRAAGPRGRGRGFPRGGRGRGFYPRRGRGRYVPTDTLRNIEKHRGFQVAVLIQFDFRQFGITCDKEREGGLRTINTDYNIPITVSLHPLFVSYFDVLVCF
jgi:hypothetical protein